MSAQTEPLPRCFLAIPNTPRFYAVREVASKAIREANFVEAGGPVRVPTSNQSVNQMVVGQLASADCVIADLTGAIPNVFLEVGVAQAMAKPVIMIMNNHSDERPSYFPDAHEYRTLIYEVEHLDWLAENLKLELVGIRTKPRRSTSIYLGRDSAPFFIDWDQLDAADTENLCRELLSQMGMRRPEWFKESKLVDLIAEFPRKDPDGFEFRETWMVSMGRRMPVEMLLEQDEFEYMLDHFFETEARNRKNFDHLSSPLVFLFISTVGEEFEYDLEERFLRWRKRGIRRRRSVTRLRYWGRDYLTTLVQQHPSIGFKYFSDEGRSLLKFRKGPEELYQENLALTDHLANANAELEEEKNRRVRAERDSVWKDISFSAAHKLGNPVFAIETDLGPLQKRILENRKEEATEVVENIRGAVDKAKGIVEQFKSLTRAQQIQLHSVALLPILQASCRVLENQQIIHTIDCDARIEVLADPERLSEVFDELAWNAAHWMDKSNKSVAVSVSLAGRDELPLEIDSERKYALIHFRDNGPGVPFENKSRIFEAFFSTYDHGTGLGLALVRRIIEGHGGIIREIGVPGVGADFEIYLPLPQNEIK